MRIIEEKVDFAYFDNLYSGQQGQYQEMLELYISEYLIYRNNLVNSLETQDVETFKKIKHKIVYSLNLLSLNNFRSLLEELGTSMAFMTDDQRQDAAHDLDAYIDELLATIEEKQKKLSVD